MGKRRPAILRGRVVLMLLWPEALQVKEPRTASWEETAHPLSNALERPLSMRWKTWSGFGALMVTGGVVMVVLIPRRAEGALLGRAQRQQAEGQRTEGNKRTRRGQGARWLLVTENNRSCDGSCERHN